MNNNVDNKYLILTSNWIEYEYVIFNGVFILSAGISMNPVLQLVTGNLCCILFGFTLTALKHK